MKLKFFLILATSLNISNINAQVSVEAKSVCEVKSNQDFDPSWQYLTTKIFPVNFENVQNIFTEQLGYKKNEINSIFISTKLTGNIFNDVEYPLYNLKIEKNNKNTSISKTDEIKIIEGMPITDNEKEINAEIKIEAVTHSKRIYGFVANQLANITNLRTPMFAGKLVGELGRLISAQNEDKSFTFVNTIKLFENTSSRNRIHSIFVYVIVPSGTSTENSILKNKLSEPVNKNETITSSLLNSAVEGDNQPYVFVVNYLSQYKSNLNLSEYSEDEISQRLFNIKANQINPKMFNYEKRLTDFLKDVANLKYSVTKYRTDKSNERLLEVLDKYRIVNFVFNSNNTEYTNDNIYNNIFKENYKEALQEAQQSLSGDDKLAFVKAVTPYIIDDSETYNPDKYEYLLTILNKQRFDDNNNDDNVHKINAIRSRIENDLYHSKFLPLIRDVKLLRLDSYDTLRKLVNSTKCIMCRVEGNNAIKYFDRQKNLENENKIDEQFKKNSNIVQKMLFEISDKLDTLDRRFQSYPVPIRSSSLREKIKIYEDMQSRREKLNNEINSISYSVADGDQKIDRLEKSTQWISQVDDLNSAVETLLNNVKTYNPSQNTNNNISYSNDTYINTKSSNENNESPKNTIINNAINTVNIFAEMMLTQRNDAEIYYMDFETANSTYLTLRAYIESSKFSDFSDTALIDIKNLTNALNEHINEIKEILK